MHNDFNPIFSAASLALILGITFKAFRVLLRSCHDLSLSVFWHSCARMHRPDNEYVERLDNTVSLDARVHFLVRLKQRLVVSIMVT